MYAVVFAFSVFIVLWTSANSASLKPNAYTLTGVMVTNGSDGNGGCQSDCVGVAGTTRTCDCRRATSIAENDITGVLIENMIPDIFDTLPNTPWASQLFTVRETTNNATIRFRFSGTTIVVREVELVLFNCPSWGFGAESIFIYHEIDFPGFFREFSSVLGSVTLSNLQNCMSLISVSIPLQMVGTGGYIIEFYNPSRAIKWLHIAEVRFSDQIISTTMAPTNPTIEETTMAPTIPTIEETTMAPTHPTTEETTTMATTIPTIEETTTTTMPPTNLTTEETTMPPTNSTTEETTTMPPTNSTTEETTTAPTVDETEETSEEATIATSETANITSTPDPQSSLISLGAIVGALVGVIVILVLLLAMGVVIIGCYMQKRRKSYRTEILQFQDVVMERNSTSTGTEMSTKMTTLTDSNVHYQKTQFDLKARSQSSPAAHTEMSPEGITTIGNGVYYSKLEEGGPPRFVPSQPISEAQYSDIATIMPDGVKTVLYDDQPADGGQYATIDNCIKEKDQALLDLLENKLSSDPSDTKKIAYSLVAKKDPPPVPQKSPELYKDLRVNAEKKSNFEEVDAHSKDLLDEEEGRNPMYVSSQADGKSGEDNPGYYSIVQDGKTIPVAKPSVFVGEYSEIEREDLPAEPQDGVYSEVNDSLFPAKKHITSGPIVLTNSVCDDMEFNLNYESSGVAMLAAVQTVRDTDIIYSNPDALENECESMYNTIYNEPITPAMFDKPPEPMDAITNNVAKEAEEENGEDEEIYSAVYNLTASMNSSQSILQLKDENIRKVKTLGTGYFGKVVLADTVGLSLKDLKMSDTDDDKTKSVRVAVKQLKLNPSPERTETFEKELKFMSRLDHPNVIRTLGACTVDKPFIMMEYMEKGDLNQYLQEFDSITRGSAATTNFTISADTLVHVCTQVDNAMKYLTSRNFIHRDLATRNCLVDSAFRTKIADFGMSRSLYESHYYVVKGHAILPVRWMAKECFYGKFSAKTDIWAFGVTMWEMFTLAKDIPYEDLDDTEVAADASNLDTPRKLLERPKDCPKEVYAIMLMCWEEEPSMRATFDKLHEELSTLDNLKHK